MKELYWKAAIFCQPSHFENASIVLLEAMQAGCCIIARNVWWNPETIYENWLFHTTKELAEKIENMINNPDELNILQKDSLVRIKKYGWENIVLEYDTYL